MRIPQEARSIIENNPLFIGSSSKSGKPNVTIVDGCMVISDETVLIFDVFMTTCKEYLLSNFQCCLLSYSKSQGIGYKIFGEAKYLTEGKEMSLAQRVLKDQGLKAKGVILVKVNVIFKFI